MFTPGVILAFGLYLIRVSTFVVAVPMYGSASGFSGYRIAMIAALSLTFYSLAGEPLVLEGPPIEYALLMFREALIGFFLAFVMQAILLALRVAGEVGGQGMGLSMSSQVDPVSGLNTPLGHATLRVVLLHRLSDDGRPSRALALAR